MALDPKVYRDPHKFYPERFLPQPAGYSEPIPEFVFGFGRRYAIPRFDCVPVGMSVVPRICPGRYLAEASLWIVAATLLAVFDICPTKDEQGNDTLPTAEFTNAIVS